MLTNRLRFLTAGESHGPAMVAVLEGIPAGLPMNHEIINGELARRQRGYGAGPRMKIERDQVEILSGVLDGVTIGSPISMKIDNLNHTKWRGRAIEPFTSPRPGHADLTGSIKYGYQDLRPASERASARETAARVAVGAVCKHFLSQFDIKVFGYVTSIGEIVADLSNIPLVDRMELAELSEVRCPDSNAAQRMKDRIHKVMKEGDTLGGIIEVIALDLPVGLGSHVHWERKLDARIGAAVLGVQAMKGVAFGSAFEISRKPGSLVHDAVERSHEKSGQISPAEVRNSFNRKANVGKSLSRPTNHAGGLEGGITNGQPLVVQAAMRPIASTLTPQRTVNLVSGEPATTSYERSDFCPVPRAVPILEGVIAFILADALLEKLGGDSLAEMKPRFDGLKRAHLDDLTLNGSPRIFWPD